MADGSAYLLNFGDSRSRFYSQDFRTMIAIESNNAFSYPKDTKLMACINGVVLSVKAKHFNKGVEPNDVFLKHLIWMTFSTKPQNRTFLLNSFDVLASCARKKLLFHYAIFPPKVCGSRKRRGVRSGVADLIAW